MERMTRCWKSREGIATTTFEVDGEVRGKVYPARRPDGVTVHIGMVYDRRDPDVALRIREVGESTRGWWQAAILVQRAVEEMDAAVPS